MVWKNEIVSNPKIESRFSLVCKLIFKIINKTNLSTISIDVYYLYKSKLFINYVPINYNVHIYYVPINYTSQYITWQYLS